MKWTECASVCFAAFFGAHMNAAIHVLMYLYYGLAAFGPKNTEISVVEKISDNHPNGMCSQACVKKQVPLLRLMWNTRLVLQLGNFRKKI